MANRLFRLGGWAFEHRKRVVALWALVLVGVIAAAAAFGGKTNDKFSVPGTESQEAQELLEQKYPAASGTYARLVFAAPKGEKLTDAENKAAVEASLAKATEARRTSRASPTSMRPGRDPRRLRLRDVVYTVRPTRSTIRSRELEASGTAGCGLRSSSAASRADESSQLGVVRSDRFLCWHHAQSADAETAVLTAIIGVAIGLVAGRPHRRLQNLRDRADPAR